jgi:hypothetical protein
MKLSFILPSITKTFMLMFVLSGLVYCFWPIKTQKFSNWQVLLPDYAHADTLIVVNADSLNAIFSREDAPATDGEIDSLLHLYCKSIK